MAATSGHLLYIDDNPDDVDLLTQAMKESRSPIELQSVPNAIQGFSYLSRQPPFREVPKPDLILLDVNLPVISGFKALEIIMGTATWSTIPVFIFSSSQRQVEVESATALGAKRFLHKPVTWDGYLAVADTITAYMHARRDLIRRAALGEDPSPAG